MHSESSCAALVVDLYLYCLKYIKYTFSQDTANIHDLRGSDTLSGEATPSKLLFSPSEKGSAQKGKNLLPVGSKFFPF